MKYIDEFRNLKIAEKLYRLINEEARGLRQVNFMEVCGTHTMAVERFGIRRMLPENVRLISGPGCPVCVTPKNYIDKAIALTAIEDVIVFSFGDMLKVPGSYSSLEKERAGGAASGGHRCPHCCRCPRRRPRPCRRPQIRCPASAGRRCRWVPSLPRRRPLGDGSWERAAGAPPAGERRRRDRVGCWAAPSLPRRHPGECCQWGSLA